MTSFGKTVTNRMGCMNARQILVNALVAILLMPFGACNAQDARKGPFMKKEVVLNVVLFNYVDRPIFDVYLNGVDIGVAGAFGGGRGIMTGVSIPLGSQTLTWRLDGPRGTPRNGETVVVKNLLTLTADQIPSEAQYLGVHIYPDQTAELTFARYMPDPSARGEKIYKENRLYGR